ncbi:MAG TPA: hypothetical protein VE134_00740 [Methanomicrobiales archaeon]|nr:hypothetical protein [Methanomicrobiales archaeon]
MCTELQKQKHESQVLNTRVTEMEQAVSRAQNELRAAHTSIKQIAALLETRMQQLTQQKPLVMRLGAMEIPLEVTGIIGGLLAFAIALLVSLQQKEVLLSPVFLSGVGMLLIGSALLKTIRVRSRSHLASSRNSGSESHPAVITRGDEH